MTPNERHTIAELIEANETEKAIEALITVLERKGDDLSHLNTARKISARFYQLTQDKMKGILFKEQEEVLKNRIHDDLLTLLKVASKEVKKPKSPKPTPLPPPPAVISSAKKQATSNIWGLILGVAAMTVAYYFLFFQETVLVVDPKLCVLADLDTGCCTENHNSFSTQQASYAFSATVLLNKNLEDPLISGVVYDNYGSVVPTENIRFTQGVRRFCYLANLEMMGNQLWQPGEYTLKFAVNDKPAGEMLFYITP
jgi:hypothetical protein